MKTPVLAALSVAVALAACGKAEPPAPASHAPVEPTKPRVEVKNVKIDADGAVITPPVVAPAPPKPAGGPQAPGLPPAGN